MKLFFTLLAVFCLSACSNNVTVKYQPTFDFSSVQSYGLFDRNSLHASYQNLSDPFRNTIELVLEQALDEKGYQYQDIDKADIIVSYYIVSYSNKALNKYSRGVKYCDYCLTPLTSRNKGNIDLTPGNLLIDLIDTKTMRSVWRASAPLDFNKDDVSYEIKIKLVEVINNMLQKLSRNSLA